VSKQLRCASARPETKSDGDGDADLQDELPTRSATTTVNETGNISTHLEPDPTAHITDDDIDRAWATQRDERAATPQKESDQWDTPEPLFSDVLKGFGNPEFCFDVAIREPQHIPYKVYYAGRPLDGRHDTKLTCEATQ
jgi:hypothetical protein